MDKDEALEAARAVERGEAPSGYVVRHTIPVFVYVEDGKVVRVVGDDNALSEPQTIVPGQTLEGAWTDDDERPLTPEELAQYTEARSKDFWPAWEWGF